MLYEVWAVYLTGLSLVFVLMARRKKEFSPYQWRPEECWLIAILWPGVGAILVLVLMAEVAYRLATIGLER